MNTFDAVAADFDRFRALPEGSPALIREAVLTALGALSRPRILDLGAGTGRVGLAFAMAGDDYWAVDSSRAMLGQFVARYAERPGLRLVQADGRALPFARSTFDAVLLVQILSGLPGWRRILAEGVRVLRPGGSVILGKSVGPPDGLDARMRERLSALQDADGLESRRRGAGREESVAALASTFGNHSRVTAARWEARRSPREFLERHRTGARFATLPPATRDDLLIRLAAWAISEFGGLEFECVEPYRFELDVFREPGLIPSRPGYPEMADDGCPTTEDTRKSSHSIPLPPSMNGHRSSALDPEREGT